MIEPDLSHDYSIEVTGNISYGKSNKTDGDYYMDIYENKAVRTHTVEKKIGDLEYYLEHEHLGSFLNNNQHYFNVTMINYISKKKNIQYFISSYGEDPQPEWIQSQGEETLKFDAPYVAENTEYRFSLTAQLLDQNRNYTKPLTIVVRRCKVDRWMRWSLEGDEEQDPKCMRWISKFFIYNIFILFIT